MKISNIKTTIKKELRSIFRDKKTLAIIFLFPLFIAFFVFYCSSSYDNNINDKEIYPIAINYNLNDIEKTIVASSSLKTEYYNSKKAMEDAFNKKKVAAYIYYDNDNNTYTIYSDEGMEGMAASSNALSYLSTYNKYLGDTYLQIQNIDLEKVYNNFTYTQEYVQGENYLLQTILSICFTYIIVAIAMASASLATSATAIEKEQGTLETLLTFPIATNELIAGKYLATVIMGLFSSLFGYVISVTSLIIAKSKYQIYEDINLMFDPQNITIGIIICLAASLLIAGLAILITSRTKTYKEAQASSQILTFITLIPMFLSMLDIPIVTKFYYAIPILSHVQILMDIFTKDINYSNIFINISSSLILSILIVSIIIKQFKSEKVLFN